MVECIREQDGKVRIQMNKKTHTNPLSKREIEELRKSPHIVSVSANTVRFTEEFKKLAYEAKTRGISVAETMRRNGIDPDILGQSRVEGFSYTLNKKAKQESGFSDRRSENYRRPPKTGEETVDQRLRQLENELAYTRQEVEFLKKLPMSRKGNCWDNAPQESFFGHMKDEIAQLVADCETYEQVAAVVDDWLDYYNNDRYQWDLEKLSPREYYRYCQTGVYPLQSGVSKDRTSRGAAPDPEV